MMEHGKFRVAGFEDEAVEFTERVQVRCTAGHTAEFGGDGTDKSADLADVVTWAEQHQHQ